MKKTTLSTIALLLTILTMLLTTSCTPLETHIERQLGPLPYSLVALDDTTVGSMTGGFLRGASGTMGPGIMFAIQGEDGAIDVMAVPVERVVLRYGKPAALTSYSSPRVDLSYRRESAAWLLREFARQLHIQVPKGSVGDYLRETSLGQD